MEQGPHAPGAPLQPESLDSLKDNLGLAKELSALFKKMQEEGSTDDDSCVDALLEKYEVIYVDEESEHESDRVDSVDALELSDTRDEILELIRPITAFLMSKGKIKSTFDPL